MEIDFTKHKEKLENFFTETKLPEIKSHKTILIVAIVVVGVFVVALSAVATYGYVYQNKVYHGVYLNNYSLAGLTPDEVREFGENLDKRLSEDGINYVFLENGQPRQIKVDTEIITPEAVIEIVSLKTDDLAGQALAVGRLGNWWQRFFAPVGLLIKNEKIILQVNLAEDKLREILRSKLVEFEITPKNAGIKITAFNPLTYEILPENVGEVFDYDKILSQTKQSLSSFLNQPIEISKIVIGPSVVKSELDDSLRDNLDRIVSAGEIGLIYDDVTSPDLFVWHLKPEATVDWLEPQKDESGQIFLNFNKEKLTEYFTINITSEINRPAETPRFRMTDGKVEEFSGGKNGREVDLSATFDKITEMFKQTAFNNASATGTVINLVVTDTQPDDKLSDINNLGITDIIGVGISTFKNSHSNRIKNIANAVRILNGKIIAPGEEFSTNAYAGPFTLENGYLAEDVIKGDQIVKEIGGGMCQIGTTLFRMAMNSGMDITERRNHSLVVSYYADPVNGNPGTDATVYDQVLDLKFMNDTGNYLLLETEMDTVKEELRFTLWGKSDGRSGSYTHPEVLKWIPTGPARIVETTTLAPGKKVCQGAFPGAVAKFTYTRITPTGETIERVFDSYYRALPSICTVGVEKKTEEEAVCPEGETCGENNLPEENNTGIIDDDTSGNSTST